MGLTFSTLLTIKILDGHTNFCLNNVTKQLKNTIVHKYVSFLVLITQILSKILGRRQWAGPKWKVNKPTLTHFNGVFDDI